MAKKSNFLKNVTNLVRTRFTNKIFLDSQEAYQEALGEFRGEFDAHPVTRELEDHTYPSDILATYGGWQRRGSLFGFMGFIAGSDPIGKLRGVLYDERVGIRLQLDKIKFRRITKGIVGNLIGPSETDLEQNGIVLDQWGDGRSWPAVLEDSGIENLSYFLSKEDYGRSGEGIQIERELNAGTRLKKIAYLNNMFRRVEKNFQKNIQKKARTRRR